jgi:hypothetical protein
MTYKTSTTGFTPLSIRTHKARKEHTCIKCSKSVTKGDNYTKTVATEDSMFISNAWHNGCFSDHSEYIDDCNKRQ